MNSSNNINKDFKIDFKNKIIIYIGKDQKAYPVKTFYSFLQDLFDEPENMMYEIPILAQSKDIFKMINGWKIDSSSRRFIDGTLS